MAQGVRVCDIIELRVSIYRNPSDVAMRATFPSVLSG